MQINCFAVDISLNLIALSAVLIIASLINFIMCGADKHLARSRSPRIPEKCFFVMAVFGGGPGLWLGMVLFRHKTKKPRFWAAAVISTAAWAALLILPAAVPL